VTGRSLPMSEQHIPAPTQAPANLSAGTAYSPEEPVG
jgi:hypothetical protein